MIRSQNVDEHAYHLQSHCIKVHALCKTDMTSKMSMTQRARFALKAAKCGILRVDQRLSFSLELNAESIQVLCQLLQPKEKGQKLASVKAIPPDSLLPIFRK